MFVFILLISALSLNISCHLFLFIPLFVLVFSGPLLLVWCLPDCFIFVFAVCSFLFNYRKSLISALIQFLISHELFIFHEFVSFLFLLLLIFSINHGGQIGCMELFKFSDIYWYLFCVQLCNQFGIKCHEVLRRCVHLCLREIIH